MNHAMQRALEILEVARKTASSRELSFLEDVRLYSKYAEPGYTDPPSGLIAVGNWNILTECSNSPTEGRQVVSLLPNRLSKMFVELEGELEWSDEWVQCEDCGGIVRTHPDSYKWKPFYSEEAVEQGSCVCLDCAKE